LVSGGTLALRTSVSATTKGINVSGEGFARREGAAGIGAIYNEGGAHTVSRSIILQGDTRFGGRAGRADNLTILRVTQTNTQQSHAFTKVGSGLITLSGTNNWWMGTTNINGGVLRLGPASYTYLPTGNIRLGTFGILGGILELTDADFTRNVGTGVYEIQWTGQGGFSAFGANRSVTLNGGATLTAGQDGFLSNNATLLLNSRYADAEINFTNPINLGPWVLTARMIHVDRGVNTAAIARLSGKISGQRSLAKFGPGLLYLSNASNDYTGNTMIGEGAVRGVPSTSAIWLGGGVLGLDSNFTGQLLMNIRWAQDGDGKHHSGGFAAYGQNRIVRLGNTTDEIAWNAPRFVQDGQELIFGHYTADAAVIWDRALNFGDAMRTIRVERGPSPFGTTVIFNRALNNSAKTGGLRLVGDGRADLNADSSNLDSNLLEISGAELRVTANARLGAIGNIALSEGGQLTILNQTGGSFDSAQIADTTNITLDTGSLMYYGSQSSPEQIGNLSLEGGANYIQIDKGSDLTPLPVFELRAQSLQRDESSRSTLNLIGWNTSGSLVGRHLSFVQSIADFMLGGIIPWATNPSDAGGGYTWLTRTNDNRLAAFSDYVTTWAASSNTSAGGNITLAAATTINSLRFGGGTLTLNNALTLNSGGLLTSGMGAVIFSGSGTLTTSQNRPLYIHSYSPLLVNGSTRFTGGMDVVTTGGATLSYNSTGTSQIGSLYIHQGTVELNSGSIQTSATGEVFIGDGAGHDELRISGGTNRLANRPKITLHGTPYGRGAEFGASEAQATLGIANGAQQTLSELHIIDRGTIDFSGGNPSAPNRLFLDLLTFNNIGAQLFVRGWHEFEDFLLIKKTAFATAPADALAQWLQLRNQIFFDGYSLDYSLLVADYNADYYQITPWGVMTGFPEPSTYGAILGAVGLGLWTWRRRAASATHVADKTKHAE